MNTGMHEWIIFFFPSSNCLLLIAQLKIGMDFFFINVPTDQTIGVHDKELPRISQRISGLSSQIDGVSMGSPLGPTLTNTFSCHQETKYL